MKIKPWVHIISISSLVIFSCTVKYPEEYYDRYNVRGKPKIACSYIRLIDNDKEGDGFVFGKKSVGYSVLLGWTRKYQYPKLRKIAYDAFRKGMDDRFFIYEGDRLRDMVGNFEQDNEKLSALDKEGIRWLLLPVVMLDTLKVVVRYLDGAKSASKVFSLHMPLDTCNCFDEFNHSAIEHCFKYIIERTSGFFAGKLGRWIADLESRAINRD